MYIDQEALPVQASHRSRYATCDLQNSHDAQNWDSLMEKEDNRLLGDQSSPRVQMSFVPAIKSDIGRGMQLPCPGKSRINCSNPVATSS